MKILVACEESQEVTKAFRERGHEAYSCDIQECSGGHPEWHICGDVIPLLEQGWDMVIAFPPCTFLTNTGNPYLNIEKYGEKAIRRFEQREEAFEFFMRFANCSCPKVAIENPIGYPNTHFRKPDQIIQPWMFGEPWSKATCLWLKGLEPLKAKTTEKPHGCKSLAYHTLYDERGKTISWNSEESKRLRSKTFPGIAQAMAEQWGNAIQYYDEQIRLELT